MIEVDQCSIVGQKWLAAIPTPFKVLATTYSYDSTIDTTTIVVNAEADAGRVSRRLNWCLPSLLPYLHWIWIDRTLNFHPGVPDSTCVSARGRVSSCQLLLRMP